MSYGFDMCFWHAKSLAAATKKAAKVISAINTPEQMRQRIDDNAYFVPSILYRAQIEDWKMAMIADEKWLYSLFNFRFVYWKEYELLGMVGVLPEDGPKPDGTVYFQNSCDQNYSLSEWPADIPFFKTKVKQYKAMLDLKPQKCLKRLLKLGFTDEETISEALEEGENSEETAEYHVLSALYHDIFDTLRLNTWLWGNDDSSFRRFALNAIHTSEQVYDLKKHLRKLVNEKRGSLGGMSIMYVPVMIRTDDTSADTLLFKFAYNHSQKPLTCDEVRAKITETVNRYMSTEEGRRLMAACSGQVTWAEVARSVPAKAYKDFSGLELLHSDDFSHCVVFDGNESAVPNRETTENQKAIASLESKMPRKSDNKRNEKLLISLQQTAYWKRRRKRKGRKKHEASEFC